MNTKDKTEVRVVAVVEMTEEMIGTLVENFSSYARNGVVQIEVSDHGLWLPHPVTGLRHYLGPPDPVGCGDA